VAGSRRIIAARRLRNQKLIATDCRRPEDVVAWLGAMQAQDLPGARWAVGTRAQAADDASVGRALDEGLILRTHVLRPTWHLVAPGDIRWMLSISAPRVHAANRSYYRSLELDAALFARSRRVIERALAGGRHLTRAALAAALAQARVAAAGMRLAYIMMHAELEGVICSGIRQGAQATYALLEERVPPQRPRRRDEALAMLARRYFTSHGPATLRDYAWWSGFTLKDAMAGAEAAELDRETIDGRTYWFASGDRRTVRARASCLLLPNYDEYLIAYKDRHIVMDAAAPGTASRAEYPHFLVVDGVLRGTWRRTLTPRQVTVDIRPSRPLSRAERQGVDAEVVRYGRFYSALRFAASYSAP
jgi:hypothetical protein